MRQLSITEINAIMGGVTAASNAITAISALFGTFSGLVLGGSAGYEAGGLLTGIIAAPVGGLWGFVIGGFTGVIISFPIEVMSHHCTLDAET